MLHTSSALPLQRQRRFNVRVASAPTEILEAQRLRYRIFAGELGARLNCRHEGIDEDLFDPFCDHLIVRDEEADRIVGTYRMLPPERARRVGGYYSETLFDLVRLRNLRGRIVELGRSCIDAEYRSGAVIALLWTGIARYMRDSGHEHLVGCASIGMGDGGHNAANIYVALADHMAAPEYRVFPRCRLPIEDLVSGDRAEVPPLLKGYLRAGARVCGEPAWDPDFNTADLLLMIGMSQVQERYAQHFLERHA